MTDNTPVEKTTPMWRFVLDYNGLWRWIDISIQPNNLHEALNSYTIRTKDGGTDGMTPFPSDSGLIYIDMRRVVAILLVDAIDNGDVIVEPVKEYEANAD